jgi:hypothetical protein
MCERDDMTPTCTGIPRNHNFDTRGRELPHPAGYYMIPRDQVPAVLAKMQYDRSILRCFRFVPLQASGPCPCPPAAPPSPPRR